MTSESARATSASQSRYRVPYANSRERAVKVVALDAVAAKLLEPIAAGRWRGAAFFTSLNFAAAGAPGQTLEAWLHDVAGHAMNLVAEVAASDFVVVVTSSGEDARAVSVIADACRAHGKSLIGLIAPREGATDSEVSASLNDLRPYTRMLVVANDADYIEAMLTALRA